MKERNALVVLKEQYKNYLSWIEDRIKQLDKGDAMDIMKKVEAMGILIEDMDKRIRTLEIERDLKQQEMKNDDIKF